jgi:hypothetical protein
VNGIMDVERASAVSAVAAGGNANDYPAASDGCHSSRPSSMVRPDTWICCD